VRGCTELLVRDGAQWRCANGHSFDVAARGYVNLLQPQDRRSLAAGDSAAAVEARARLLARGAGRDLFEELIQVVRALGLPEGAAVVELGSGTGELLRELAATPALVCIGIDLSVAAIEHAARADRAASAAAARPKATSRETCTWVVANADRRLPLLDGSAELVLSVQGRRNPSEVLRVLASGGHWLVAVPGVDDLVELRTATRGAQSDAIEPEVQAPHSSAGAVHAAEPPASRSRLDVLLGELVELGLPFELARRGTSRARHHLDAAALADLCVGTYNGLRTREAERVAALPALDVTFHSDWALLRRP
jgi:23S rRNA (guanine745-N1)-methyltransferase